jgi:hypothetical protein
MAALGQTRQVVSATQLPAINADEFAIPAFESLPARFELNVGQTAPQVRFLTRNSQQSLFLAADGLVLTLGRPVDRTETTVRRSAVQFCFDGANPSTEIVGQHRLDGPTNYFLGERSSFRSVQAPSYSRVRYKELYPRIDLVLYGSSESLEYDFVVMPGADPRAIRLTIRGTSPLRIDELGNLIAETPAGTISQRPPVTFQELDGRRQIRGSRYVLTGERTYGIELAAFDPARPLIIDPALSFSTYLGGSGENQGVDLVVDHAGSAYITGFTSSVDFPTTPGAFQSTGGSSAFVAKVSPDGLSLEYSTYLSGCTSFAIAVDPAGNAYLTGVAGPPGFPATTGAFQTICNGSSDAFVAKLDATGSALVYATFLGGSSSELEQGFGIAVDSIGDAFVIGHTASRDFPTMNPLQQTYGGGPRDAFVTRLDSTGSALVYSTYLGGSNHEFGADIALDDAGQVYVTGSTKSADFPTTRSSVQPKRAGNYDVFAAKLDAEGSRLLYSTYLGGKGNDEGDSIAVDDAGTASITGTTQSLDFPVTSSALQGVYGGSTNLLLGGDAYVARLNADGTALHYATYLGGSRSDKGQRIVVDGDGNVLVTGYTLSADFPTTCQLQQTFGGGIFDAFVAVVDSAGASLIFSSYLGGSGDDVAGSAAWGPGDTIYLIGGTSSPDFPIVNALQPVRRGATSDVFVTRIVLTDLGEPASDCPPPTADSLLLFSKGNPVDALVAGAKTKKYSFSLHGSGFTKSSRILVEGMAVTTEYISPTLLQGRLPAGRVPDVQAWPVEVRNVDGQRSGTLLIGIRTR